MIIKFTTLFILSLLFFQTNALVPFCYLGEPPFFPPTSVVDVYFRNFGTILAFGDSITSGFAAGDTSFSSVNEYRGLSFVTGNYTNQYSIVNLLSAGQGYDIVPGGSSNLLNGIRAPGTYYPLYDGFNGASKGMESMISTQINFVKNQATSYYGSTLFNNSWKLVSVYMGLFKACQICNTIDAPYQTNNIFWKSYYDGLISELISQLNSKTIISLIGLPKISQFYSSSSSTCKTYNQNNNICPCLWTESTSTLDNIINSANQGMKNAIESWRTNTDQTLSTVGVVYQPFLTNTIFPSTTLSPVDCFHPNAAGHKLMAIGLWNNIRQFSSSEKSTSVSTSTTPICEDFFFPMYDPDSPY